MPFPKTVDELLTQGYQFQSLRRCRGKDCGRSIEMWTTPAGKVMPLDPETYQPHWATCPNAQDFKRSKQERGKG